jgi:pheromone shutdown protein TraB
MTSGDRVMGFIFELFCALFLFVGIVACIVFCILANTTPGNDVYGEWALGSAVLAGIGVILASAADD